MTETLAEKIDVEKILNCLSSEKARAHAISAMVRNRIAVDKTLLLKAVEFYEKDNPGYAPYFAREAGLIEKEIDIREKNYYGKFGTISEIKQAVEVAKAHKFEDKAKEMIDKALVHESKKNGPFSAGHLAKELRQYERALQLYLEAEKLETGWAYKQFIPESIGELAASLGKHETAGIYYEKAEKYNSAAGSYKNAGNLEKAVECLLKENPDRIHLGYAGELARLLAENDKPEEAISFCRKTKQYYQALEIASTHGIEKKEKNELYKQGLEFYSNNPKVAADFAYRFKGYKDAVAVLKKANLFEESGEIASSHSPKEAFEIYKEAKLYDLAIKLGELLGKNQEVENLKKEKKQKALLGIETRIANNQFDDAIHAAAKDAPENAAEIAEKAMVFYENKGEFAIALNYAERLGRHDKIHAYGVLTDLRYP